MIEKVYSDIPDKWKLTFIQTCTQMSAEIYSQYSPNGNRPDFQQKMNGFLKMCYIFIMEYCLVVLGNKVHVTIWMNFENIMLNERNYLQKMHIYNFIDKKSLE